MTTWFSADPPFGPLPEAYHYDEQQNISQAVDVKG